MKTALIFNIQKFCVHDGPGIRTTVFFKGCPLNCQWCHNPESQSFQRELLLNPEKCGYCGRCEKICAQSAMKVTETTVSHDPKRCVLCEKCVDYCVNNAREIAGKEYTVSELMKEIEKDRPFYEQSGGGVTLSGGEVLSQIDFVEELVKACAQQGISVAIDTCGYAPFSSFERILNNVDVFLYDLKIMDSELHRQYTGQDNSLILDNLRRLSANNANIILRLPLIDEINTTDKNINEVIYFCKNFTISTVNLLPYHNIGRGKYRRLNRRYGDEAFACPTDERLAEIQSKLEQAGFKVKIGG